MTRETVGKISSDLIINTVDNTHSAHDQALEQLADYEDNIQKAIQSGKQQYGSSFYVVVLTKKERLMQNVIRNYFLTRKTCPTPEWDQTVYFYNNDSGTIEFLWVIPAKDTCEYIKENALTIEKEEHALRDFVLAYYDGSLLRLSKSRNKEAVDSPLLV